jgi:ABC-2 type transport system permease protein
MTPNLHLAPAARLLVPRELRAQLRTFLLWLVPVALLVVMVASLQPSMAGDGGALAAKLDAMPEGMRRAFGISRVDFTRPPAYLSINFVYVTLTASLFAAGLGATVIAKEGQLRTVELLFAMPVERRSVLLGKVGAAAIYGLGFNVALAAVALGSLAGFVSSPLEAGLVAALFVGTAALGACFLGVGMLIATLVSRPRTAGNAALGVALGAYLVSIVGAASPDADWLAYASPFRYVEPGRIVAAGGVDPVAVAALVAIGVGCGVAAIARYQRRDLAA